MLNAPCSSWLSSQLKRQTAPTGLGVRAGAEEEGLGLQLIWTLGGIAGTGQPNAEDVKDDS